MRRGARSEPYAERRAAREEGKPKAGKNGSALGRFGFFFLGKRRCASRPPPPSFWACSGRGAGAALAYNRRKGAPRERRLISPWGFQSTG